MLNTYLRVMSEFYYFISWLRQRTSLCRELPVHKRHGQHARNASHDCRCPEVLEQDACVCVVIIPRTKDSSLKIRSSTDHLILED